MSEDTATAGTSDGLARRRVIKAGAAGAGAALAWSVPRINGIGITPADAQACSQPLPPPVAQIFSFTMNSDAGGLFDPAAWPGGQATQNQNGDDGCGNTVVLGSVTINRPSGNIDLVCTLGNGWNVASFSGFASCVDNTCTTTACPPLGIGSCCTSQNWRPSCSAALNGSGTAVYTVSCTP